MKRRGGLAKLFKMARKSAKPKSNAAQWVTYDKLALESMKIADEWGGRGVALMRMAPYLAAMLTYRNLPNLIPGDAAWNTYRRAIRLAAVGSPDLGAYAVFVRPTSGVDRDIDGKKEVLYIRSRRSHLRPVTPAVAVLAKFSPWTTTTIPYSPKRTEAVTVLRRASAREVKTIEEMRKKDKPVWTQELLRAGISVPARAEALKRMDTKVVLDVAYAGARLEFGYGRSKRVPHWRPSIRIAVQTVMHRLAKDRRFAGLMSSKGTAWKKWPPRVAGRLSVADLKSFAKFQHRIGIQL